MTATHPDLAALCAAIDRGDDGALGPLADLLEEQGDGRAAGLRTARLLVRKPERMGFPVRWGWEREGDLSWALAGGSFDRLPDADALKSARIHADYRERASYPTRSRAFLALAEALASP